MKNEDYWMVKKSFYGVVCITPEFHGSVIVWNTLEEAEQDLEERVEGFLEKTNNRFVTKKVDDGYEILEKETKRTGRCYKIFDAQELE